MDISVTLPTMGNNLSSLRKTLYSLSTQSHDDFKLIIILPKNYGSTDSIKALLENKALDFDLIRQTGYGFENAMNSALNSTRDININIDDDAIYYKDHIENYIKRFERGKYGVISGIVNGKPSYANRTKYLLFLNRLSNGTPISNNLRGYETYINSSGFLTSNFLQFLSRKALKKSIFPVGVNFGWIGEIARNFRLIEYSKKGTLNETYLSFHAVKMGLDAIVCKGLDVKHEHTTTSLSSSEGPSDDLLKLVEFYFSPLILETVEVDIEPIDNLVRIVKSIPFERSISRFLPLLLERVKTGIQENWDSSKVQKEYGLILRQISSGDFLTCSKQNNRG